MVTRTLSEFGEAQVIDTALSAIRDRLPARWELRNPQRQHPRGRGAEALVEISAPDGQAVILVVTCKRRLVPSQLPGVLEQLENLRASQDRPSVGVVVARYLSPSVREWLEDRDVSYADATGNIRLTSTWPAIFLRDRGADSDPWRPPGRPRGTLRGAPATRVVRALADFQPPLSVRRLIELSGASTGATYRVLEFLEQEALLTRGPRGAVETVDWRRLLERWAQDYGFARDNPTGRYLAPRGLPALLQRLPVSGLDYAVTGSLAAQLWAPYAPPRLASLYVVGGLEEAAETMGLRPVDTGANVLLATPSADAVLARKVLADGVTYAAPSQVAVDLLGGPGRSPEEGRALLDWMETDESAWRR